MHFRILTKILVFKFAAANYSLNQLESSLPDIFENFINSQDFISSDLELRRSARNQRSGCRLEKGIYSQEELIQDFICHNQIARMWLESKVSSFYIFFFKNNSSDLRPQPRLLQLRCPKRQNSACSERARSQQVRDTNLQQIRSPGIKISLLHQRADRILGLLLHPGADD